MENLVEVVELHGERDAAVAVVGELLGAVPLAPAVLWCHFEVEPQADLAPLFLTGQSQRASKVCAAVGTIGHVDAPAHEGLPLPQEDC
jgi:hypothetical protein